MNHTDLINDIKTNIFQNHIAKFLINTPEITVIDFAKPNSKEYWMRYMFDNKKCRLYIYGDFGELTLQNYYNITYDKIQSILPIPEKNNNFSYFVSKIKSHERPIFFYSFDRAKTEIYDYLEKNILSNETDKNIETVTNEIMSHYNEDYGFEYPSSPIIKLYYNFPTTLGDIKLDQTIVNAGKLYAPILWYYIVSLQMALKQLKGKKNN